MAHITDQVSALIGLNNAMQKVTETMGRMAVSGDAAAHGFGVNVRDFADRFQHYSFFLDHAFGHGNSGHTDWGQGRGKKGGNSILLLKALSDLNETMLAVGKRLGAMLLTGMEGGAPDAFGTMTGSFKLLAATIGAEFLPQMVALSVWAQGAVEDFNGLSEEWKAVIKVGVAVTAALTLFGPAILAACRGIYTLGTAAYAGARSVGRGVMMNPTGAVAGVGLASAALLAHTMMKEDNAKHAEGFQKVLANSEELRKNETPEQFQAHRDYQIAQAFKTNNASTQFNTEYHAAKHLYNTTHQDRFENLSPHQRADIYLGMREQSESSRLEHITQANDDVSGRSLHDSVANAHWGWKVNPWTGPAAAFYGHVAPTGVDWGTNHLMGDARRNAEQAQADTGTSLKRIQAIRAGRDTFSGNESVGNRHGALSAARGLMMDIQGHQQPAYFGVEDMYKKVQLDALNQNPLQMEMRDLQIKMLEELYKANQYLREGDQGTAIDLFLRGRRAVS